MSFAANYLNRYSSHREGILKESPSTDLSLIITIPSYKEDKLLSTLESIKNCLLPPTAVEVIILFNYPQADENEAFHIEQYEQTLKWAEKNSSSSLRFLPMLKALPTKEAGVGLARKILMDEAVIRFNKVGKPNGIIANLDADCRCERNYLIELFNYFNQYPQISTCSVYFEHPIIGDEYDTAIYHAIAQYELYLRYYIEGLRYAGFPFAFHTIGSAFAVRAHAYIKQGGMNKRKAGEDFYFLNKMMLLGSYGELNTTAIYPSPRVSDRVPFGTGAAIKKITAGTNDYTYTWNPQIFEILKEFFDSLSYIYQSQIIPSFHPLLNEFIKKHQGNIRILEAYQNASQEQTFIKRFFYWFDGLKVLQFIRFAHLNGLSKIHLLRASNSLLKMEGGANEASDIITSLKTYRLKQRHHSITLNW
ncbi:MAG: hypothetical protein N2662_02100 [Bacteroidales bacterium]|nr:hypothetical protein [Bacteroidales bacterium]